MFAMIIGGPVDPATGALTLAVMFITLEIIPFPNTPRRRAWDALKRRLLEKPATPIDEEFQRDARTAIERHRDAIAKHFGLHRSEVHFGVDLASGPDLTSTFEFDANGLLLTGHHRLRAMKDLGLLPPGFSGF